MIVVAAGRPLDGGDGRAAGRRAVDRRIGDVDGILIPGVHLDLGEVEAAAPDAFLVVDAPPTFAGVVGAVQAAELGGIDQGVNAARVVGGNADADAAELLFRRGQAAGELVPGGAAVGGLEQAAARALPGAVLPRALPRRPEHGVDRFRGGRVEGQGDGAGVLVLVQHLLPGRAAVGRAEDAALGVGAVGVAEDGDEEAVGVARVHDHRRDLLAVAQPQVLPGLAAVGGLVNAVAGGQVRALQPLAAANIEDGRVRRSHGQGAGQLPVEERHPDVAVVGGLPDAAVVDADVKDVRMAGHAGGADGPAAAERPDHAPAQAGV